MRVPTVQTVLLTCPLKRGCTILHSQLARSYCVGEINWTSLQYISMVMKCWFYCPQASNLVNHKGTTTFCFRILASHQGLSLRFLYVGGPAIVVQPHVFQCFNSQPVFHKCFKHRTPICSRLQYLMQVKKWKLGHSFHKAIIQVYNDLNTLNE